MTKTQQKPAPVVCALVDGDLVEQTLEWTDLAPVTLTTERIEKGIVATYPLAIADKIEELAHRESQCCGSWMNVATARLEDTIKLTLTTPNPDGLALIYSIAGVADDG